MNADAADVAGGGDVADAADSSAGPTVRRARRREEATAPPPTTLLWQRLVVGLLVGTSSRVQRMTPAAADRLGDRLGDLGYALAATARHRARANLSLALGDDVAPDDREGLVRRVFRHFGRAVVGFLRVPFLTREQLDSRVACEGWEHVEAARAQGRGVLLVTAHLGEWEVLCHWLTRVQGVPLTAVAKDPKQPALAAYMRTRREASGMAVHSKGDSPLPLVRALRRGEAVLLLPDQNSGDLFVPFFGVPTGTVAGPATMAQRTGAPLVPIYCLSDKGRYRVTCLPPVPTGTAVSGGGDADTLADRVRIMTALNAVLEEAIRAAPSQWLWLHNRWKSAFEEKNRGAWAHLPTSVYEDARARWTGKGTKR